MKTAKELWDKNKNLISDFNNGEYYVLMQSQFYNILAKHDKEIISKIDEMYQDVNYMYSDKEVLERTGYNKALTELKQWMKK